MNESQFRARVDELFDARMDPLDDAEIRDYLLAHPDRAEDFATWRCAVQTLVDAPEPARALPVRGLAAVAAVLVIGLVGWRLLDRPVSAAAPRPTVLHDARVIDSTFDLRVDRARRGRAHTHSTEFRDSDTRLQIAKTWSTIR